jgi:hypothetical protein
MASWNAKPDWALKEPNWEQNFEIGGLIRHEVECTGTAMSEIGVLLFKHLRNNLSARTS